MDLESNPVDAGKPVVDAASQTKVINSGSSVVDATQDSGNPHFVMALKKRDDAVEKLREEKRKNSELSAKLDKIRLEEAEKNGQWKEAHDNIKNKYETLSNNWTEVSVRSAVDAAADKYGCVNTRLAFLAGKTKLLSFDSDTGEVDGVDAFWEDLKDTEPTLFQTPKTPTVNPSLPGGQLRVAPEKVDLSELSTDELKARLRQAVKGA